jgi:acid phosphatase
MTRLPLLLLPLLFTASPLLAAHHRAVAHPGLPRGMAAVVRVFVVVLENEDANVALQQPFLASLAASGALLRNYHAVSHPSQPNYIAMVAGDAYGIDYDTPVTIDVAHLGDLLDAHGLSWKVYAEDYPGGCFLGSSFTDSDPGAYLRRHVPFLDFADVQSDPARCNRIAAGRQFDADLKSGALPQFAMYIPDSIHDGHDTGVAVADTWLSTRFGTLVTDPAFMDGTLFVVVFDEGTTNGPNIVYCSMNGAGIRSGAISDSWYDHYSLLRTFEQILHCGSLHRQDEAADAISDVWAK